jgi:Xaa-Pro aminopeptidase
MDIHQKIEALREAMIQRRLDAFIVPSTDPHQGEYIHEHWQARQWLTGFSGSAGTLVVTRFYTGVWTDSRYFLQAEEELKGTGVELVRLVIPHTPEFVDWLVKNLPKGSVVGVDGRVVSASLFSHLEATFELADIRLTGEFELVREIWAGRPSLPLNPVFELDVAFSGKARSEKLEEIRLGMRQKGVEFHLISSLDDVAWTLNLRGNDIPFNPLFISYLLIGLEQSILFIHQAKVSEEIRQKLLSEKIYLSPYEELSEILPAIISGKTVMLQSSKSSFYLYELVKKHAVLIDEPALPVLMKAIKNHVEQAHLRKVMEKDGVALIRFFRWLEGELPLGRLTEYDCGEMIRTFRSESEGYVGESFAPIVGYEGHGAIVHYSADKQASSFLRPEGILLVDSGGQYLNGTTDITRTIALGKPTRQQIKHFTLVLKGHIRLASVKFPYGTKGFHLDSLARLDLWNDQLNYGHGTGHGVGFFLNVHEGPQGISPNPAINQVVEPGMVTSNEPGIYVENQYGIRIENLILSKELQDQGTGRYLEFETLTLFPIDLELVDEDLLDQKEKDWLNGYHAEVFSRLSPYLEEEEQKWLSYKTRVL